MPEGKAFRPPLMMCGRQAEGELGVDAVAEGEGFEPPLPVKVKRFSRPPVSTAHTSLRVRRINSLAARVKRVLPTHKRYPEHSFPGAYGAPGSSGHQNFTFSRNWNWRGVPVPIGVVFNGK
jgi:hypothetical protein